MLFLKQTHTITSFVWFISLQSVSSWQYHGMVQPGDHTVVMTYTAQHLPAPVDLRCISVYLFWPDESLVFIAGVKSPSWGQSRARLWGQNAQAWPGILVPILLVTDSPVSELAPIKVGCGDEGLSLAWERNLNQRSPPSCLENESLPQCPRWHAPCVAGPLAAGRCGRFPLFPPHTALQASESICHRRGSAGPRWMSPRWIPSLLGKWHRTEEGIGDRGRGRCVCVCVFVCMWVSKREGGFLLYWEQE